MLTARTANSVANAMRGAQASTEAVDALFGLPKIGNESKAAEAARGFNSAKSEVTLGGTMSKSTAAQDDLVAGRSLDFGVAGSNSKVPLRADIQSWELPTVTTTNEVKSGVSAGSVQSVAPAVTATPTTAKLPVSPNYSATNPIETIASAANAKRAVPAEITYDIGSISNSSAGLDSSSLLNGIASNSTIAYRDTKTGAALLREGLSGIDSGGAKAGVGANGATQDAVPHVGAGGSGFSPVNTTPRMDNCTACTTAHIINKIEGLGAEDIMTANQVEATFGYTGKEREFTWQKSLSYIEDATEMKAHPAAFMSPEADPGHYVVFPRKRDNPYLHLMYGEVLPDGTRYLYDPQIGKTMNWSEMLKTYDGGAKTFNLKSGQ